MDPRKVAAVQEWPKPVNKKELKQFIGFINYYRRFIKGFSGIAKPLHVLTGNANWKWEEGEQKAFEQLKQAITAEPVLAVPTNDGQFRVEADSSNFANGAVLSQLVDGKWRPIAYRSQALSPTEQNYEIYDRELLGIVRALKEWQHYLEGNPYPVRILSNHKNLEYFCTAQKLNRRQAQWSLFLS